MNTQRAVIWVGFLGVSAALAWAPDHWCGQDDGVAAFAGKPAPATESAAPIVGAGLPAKGPEVFIFMATFSWYPRTGNRP